jgi:hypothetical protein
MINSYKRMAFNIFQKWLGGAELGAEMMGKNKSQERPLNEQAERLSRLPIPADAERFNASEWQKRVEAWVQNKKERSIRQAAQWKRQFGEDVPIPKAEPPSLWTEYERAAQSGNAPELSSSGELVIFDTNGKEQIGRLFLSRPNFATALPTPLLVSLNEKGDETQPLRGTDFVFWIGEILTGHIRPYLP